MKVFDRVVSILRSQPECRSSDKALMWTVWRREGSIGWNPRGEYMTFPLFKSATTPESITRARRKAQELYPELSATDSVKKQRSSKEAKKGNFIFQESKGGSADTVNKINKDGNQIRIF